MRRYRFWFNWARYGTQRWKFGRPIILCEYCICNKNDDHQFEGLCAIGFCFKVDKIIDPCTSLHDIQMMHCRHMTSLMCRHGLELAHITTMVDSGSPAEQLATDVQTCPDNIRVKESSQRCTQGLSGLFSLLRGYQPADSVGSCWMDMNGAWYDASALEQWDLHPSYGGQQRHSNGNCTNHNFSLLHIVPGEGESCLQLLVRVRIVVRTGFKYISRSRTLPEIKRFCDAFQAQEPHCTSSRAQVSLLVLKHNSITLFPKKRTNGKNHARILDLKHVDHLPQSFCSKPDLLLMAQTADHVLKRDRTGGFASTHHCAVRMLRKSCKICKTYTPSW